MTRLATGFRLILAACLMVARVGLSVKSEDFSGAIDVVVSIPPQAYFVKRIGGDMVNITTLLEPGQSPAIFDPSPKTVKILQSARLYFTIGVPFEKHLLSKLYDQESQINIVDLNLFQQSEPPAGFLDISDSHAHENAPHVWLNPVNVKRMAAKISDELSRVDPGHSDLFEANRSGFSHELDTLDMYIRARLANVKESTFFVYHPAYGQFAEAYGLTQVPIEVAGKEPGARQLQNYIKLAREHDARAIFVQPQFSRDAANTIAGELGVPLVVMDPLACNYIDNMKRMAELLACTLGDSSIVVETDSDEGVR